MFDTRRNYGIRDSKYSITSNIIISAEELGFKKFTHSREWIHLKTMSQIWQKFEFSCGELLGECYT